MKVSQTLIEIALFSITLISVSFVIKRLVIKKNSKYDSNKIKKLHQSADNGHHNNQAGRDNHVR